MKTIYMVDPDHFGVEYDINPWMSGNIGQVDRAAARQQWQGLHAALCQLGARVRVLEAWPGLPDATFVANAGVLRHGQFLPGRFRHEERAGEEDMFIEVLAAEGIEVIPAWLDNQDRALVSFEGAGDALFSADRDILWVGTGFRTTAGISERLAPHVAARIIELELIDPRFYHLDTCFCPLDTGDLLWYPGAFSPASRQGVITAHRGGLIEVTATEALQFACNAVSVGKAVALPQVDENLVARLEEQGYQVLVVDMSQFIKAGGACKCLTLENVE